MRIPAVAAGSLMPIGTPRNGASPGVRRLPRAVASAVVVANRDERIQLGIEPLDPLEVGLDELHGGDLALADSRACSAAEMGEREVQAPSSHRASGSGLVGADRDAMARAGIEPATPRFSAVCSTD